MTVFSCFVLYYTIALTSTAIKYLFSLYLVDIIFMKNRYHTYRRRANEKQEGFDASATKMKLDSLNLI